MNWLTYFTKQSIDRYDELTRVMNPYFILPLPTVAFLEKTLFDLIGFYSWQSELRYFWLNYFLNNISLLDGLLKLVCLLMVYSYKYFIMHLPAECRYFFWWNMFFKNGFTFTWIINPFPLLNTFSFLFFFFDFFTYQLDFSDLRFNLIHSKLLNLLKSHTFFTDNTA